MLAPRLQVRERREGRPHEVGDEAAATVWWAANGAVGGGRHGQPSERRPEAGINAQVSP
jgi:hypothetical protein